MCSRAHHGADRILRSGRPARGRGIYIDSNMGHAYVAAKAATKRSCSASARARTTALMSSLMTIRKKSPPADKGSSLPPTATPRVRRLRRSVA